MTFIICNKHDDFIRYQNEWWQRVKKELKAGRKGILSHWFWFIFPTLPFIGASPTNDDYALRCTVDQYLSDKTLRERYVEAVQLVHDHLLNGKKLRDIFPNSADIPKFYSSLEAFQNATDPFIKNFCSLVLETAWYNP